MAKTTDRTPGGSGPRATDPAPGGGDSPHHELRPDDLTPHLDGLFRHALALTRDADRAADAVQDTVVRALERRERYTGSAPLEPWLHRVLRNLVIDTARRSQREIPVEEVEARWRTDAYTVDAERVLERAEDRGRLEDALARLPHIYRVAVVLHDVDGWTVRRISEAEGISLPAAKQRLRRGRLAMVDALAGADARRVASVGVPLDCWEARRHVSDYLDGDLDADTCHVLEAHLEGCPTCPPLYASLVGVHDGLDALRDDDAVVPPALAARLRDSAGGGR